jgi:hypothetical protein
LSEEQKKALAAQKGAALETALQIKMTELNVKKQAYDRAERLERHAENDKQYRRILKLGPVRAGEIMHRLREKNSNFVNENDQESYERLATSMNDLRNFKDRLYTDRVQRYKKELKKITDFDKYTEISREARMMYDRREQVKKYITGSLYSSKYRNPDVELPLDFGADPKNYFRMEIDKRNMFRKGLAWYTSHYASTVMFVVMSIAALIAHGNLAHLEMRKKTELPTWAFSVITACIMVVCLAIQVYTNRMMQKTMVPKLIYSLAPLVCGFAILITLVTDLLDRYDTKDPPAFRGSKVLLFGVYYLFCLILFTFCRSFWAQKTNGGMSLFSMKLKDTILFLTCVTLPSLFTIVPVIGEGGDTCRDKTMNECRAGLRRGKLKKLYKDKVQDTKCTKSGQAMRNILNSMITL